MSSCLYLKQSRVSRRINIYRERTGNKGGFENFALISSVNSLLVNNHSSNNRLLAACVVSWSFSSHMMFIRGLVFDIVWVFSMGIYYLNNEKIPPVFNFEVKRNSRHVKSKKEIGLKYLSWGSLSRVGEKPRWSMPVVKLLRVAGSTATGQTPWRNFTVGGNCQGHADGKDPRRNTRRECRFRVWRVREESSFCPEYDLSGG